ncbi:MAG: DUF885 domain-containing protein [Dehalococcoidia bacterium]
MSRVYEIASDYVDRYAALDPLAATSMGVPGHDAEMTDYSPAGANARAQLSRETLARLGPAPLEGERDRIARDVMVERLELELELHEAGEHLRNLNVIASPVQRIRSNFDLMPRTTAEDWHNIAVRMGKVPEGVNGLCAGLSAGLAEGLPAAKRQVIACIRQAETWSGAQAGAPSFFATLLDSYDQGGGGDSVLRGDLERAAAVAAQGYADLRRYLEEQYLPRASERDAVGRDRYALRARVFNGLTLDLEETYAWGWEEVRRIEEAMAETAGQVVTDGGVRAAIDRLERDPKRVIEGAEPFRRWMQELQDKTIAELDGVHFDIPEPVKRLEAMIAPPGGALAMYYTGPSEDFSRPGRTWYPTDGRARFPLWQEMSVAYHEGVPGHHLQIAQARYLGETLSRYQRLLAGTSGYVEGWALYAERLMADLGYLDDPGFYLGFLSSQALRAARVVVDIGLHLELEIPEREAFHGGEPWQPELALAFLLQHSFYPEEMLRSEVDRYLGWPGQAISYKVGERVWLQAREDARRRHGNAFDLKAFHAQALNLGPMSLAQLQRELAAL